MRNYPVNPPRTSKLPDGFNVERAENGGWVLLLRGNPGEFRAYTAAFTDTTDLLDFLAAELNGE
jgi:hypothetical protein